MATKLLAQMQIFYVYLGRGVRGGGVESRSVQRRQFVPRPIRKMGLGTRLAKTYACLSAPTRALSAAILTFELL